METVEANMTCDDYISRQSVKRKLQEQHDFFINAYGGFSNMSQNDKSRVDEIINCIAMVVNEPSVTPKEKTGKWYSTTIQGEIDGQIVKAFVCSECGAISVFRMVDGNIVNGGLCPNCEAKMQEVSE